MSKAKVALGASIGVVAGAVAGFVTGILTAPKSGKATRKDIKDTAVKTKGEVVKEIEGAKGKAEEYKNRTEQAVEGAKKGFATKPPTKK